MRLSGSRIVVGAVQQLDSFTHWILSRGIQSGNQVPRMSLQKLNKTVVPSLIGGTNVDCEMTDHVEAPGNIFGQFPCELWQIAGFSRKICRVTSGDFRSKLTKRSLVVWGDRRKPKIIQSSLSRVAKYPCDELNPENGHRDEHQIDHRNHHVKTDGNETEHCLEIGDHLENAHWLEMCPLEYCSSEVEAVPYDDQDQALSKTSFDLDLEKHPEPGCDPGHCEPRSRRNDVIDVKSWNDMTQHPIGLHSSHNHHLGNLCSKNCGFLVVDAAKCVHSW